MNILLDYVFRVTQVLPTPAASTLFLKQVGIVVKPNAGGTSGDITECENMTEVGVVTDNTDALQLFNAGLTKVFVIQASTLVLATILEEKDQEFYTVLVSGDYNDAEIGALAIGEYKGVVGLSSASPTLLEAQNLIAKRTGFFGNATNKAKNMMFAFGKLLSQGSNWFNQQYIVMPFDDGVNTLAQAKNFFNDRISFVIADAQFGTRLGFFGVGGQAIIAPYVIRNFEIDLQSKALQFISLNQPAYTPTNAALLEDELSKVTQEYIDRGLLASGTVSVTLNNDNFLANAEIIVPPPNALWAVDAILRQQN